jgi:hypothetical protein
LCTISTAEWTHFSEQHSFAPIQNWFSVRSNTVPNVQNYHDHLQTPAFVPFPQCLSNPALSTLLHPDELKELFAMKLAEEEDKLIPLVDTFKGKDL